MSSFTKRQSSEVFDITTTEWTAILLSLRVAIVATLVATPIGIALAWLLARRNFWGKSFVDALVHLPLVLPPARSARGWPIISASSSRSAGPARRSPAA